MGRVIKEMKERKYPHQAGMKLQYSGGYNDAVDEFVELLNAEWKKLP